MRKIKFYLKRLIKSERGEAILTLPYAMFIFLVLVLVSVDVGGYMSTKWKVRTAASETLNIMKMENGFDNSTKMAMDQFLTKLNLEPSRVNVNATPKYVQRGDIVTIKLETEYVFVALKPLGNELSWIVKEELSGLAQEFRR